MTDKTPEKMWIADVSPPKAGWRKAFPHKPLHHAQHYQPYIREDIHKAEIAALLEKAWQVAEDADYEQALDGVTYCDREQVLGGIDNLISDDAKAALEAAVQEAVQAERDKLARIYANMQPNMRHDIFDALKRGSERDGHRRRKICRANNERFRRLAAAIRKGEQG